MHIACSTHYTMLENFITAVSYALEANTNRRADFLTCLKDELINCGHKPIPKHFKRFARAHL